MTGSGYRAWAAGRPAGVSKPTASPLQSREQRPPPPCPHLGPNRAPTTPGRRAPLLFVLSCCRVHGSVCREHRRRAGTAARGPACGACCGHPDLSRRPARPRGPDLGVLYGTCKWRRTPRAKPPAGSRPRRRKHCGACKRSPLRARQTHHAGAEDDSRLACNTSGAVGQPWVAVMCATAPPAAAGGALPLRTAQQQRAGPGISPGIS